MLSHLPEIIVSVRHPECFANLGIDAYDAALAAGISNRDSPLTKRGEIQAQYTAAYLMERFGSFDLAFASDFIRTHSIPTVLGQAFAIEPRIGERWHGALHERGSAFFAEFPEQRELYDADYYNYRAPEGESCPDVEARLSDFLMTKGLFVGARSMLISGHGISGLCLRKVLFGASYEDWSVWFERARLDNASVTVYERQPDGQYEITLYNHLPWKEHLEVEKGIEA